MTPLAPERFAIQFTIGKDTHEMLEHAEALLSHSIPSGDIAQVLHRVFELAIPMLEKQKFGAGAQPRTRRRRSNDSRHIPAHVKLPDASLEERVRAALSHFGPRHAPAPG